MVYLLLTLSARANLYTCTQEEPHIAIATRTPTRDQSHRLTPLLLLELIVWPHPVRDHSFGASETRLIGESGTQTHGLLATSPALYHYATAPSPAGRYMYNVTWEHCENIDVTSANQITEIRSHSKFMTKILVGYGDKSWSNLGWIRIDQDFTRWLTFDQHFTIRGLDLD